MCSSTEKRHRMQLDLLFLRKPFLILPPKLQEKSLGVLRDLKEKLGLHESLWISKAERRQTVQK